VKRDRESISRNIELPLYLQLIDNLRKKIVSGEYKSNNAIPKEEDLCKIYGLSRTTVRHALSQLVRENLLFRIKGKGTFISLHTEISFPNQTRVNANLGDKHIVMFYPPIKPPQTHSFPRVIAEGVKNFLFRHNCKFTAVEVFSSSSIADALFEYRDICDGFIICHSIRDPSIIETVSCFDSPIVMVNSYPESASLNAVVSDDVKGMYSATEYLIKKKHLQIAYLTTESMLNSSVKMRLQGYRQAMLGYKLKPLELILDRSLSLFESGMSGVKRILAEFPETTAIICLNDMIAIGVFEELKRINVKVGDDIAVMGYGDDIEMHAYFHFEHCPLSSVAIPRFKMGGEAARFLLRIMKNSKRSPEIIYLETKVIPREST